MSISTRPPHYAPPAAGEHTGQQQAFGDNPFAVAVGAATATAVEKFVVPAFEEIAAAGLKALGEAALATAAGADLPVALTAGLILGSSTPAGAGYPAAALITSGPGFITFEYTSRQAREGYAYG